MLLVQSDVSSCVDSLMKPLPCKKQHASSDRQSSPSAPNSVRFDVACRTYADTDTLALYFTKAVRGFIANTDHIAPGIVADYSKDERLVSLDINSASLSAACHTFNTASVVDGKPPLALSVKYDDNADRLDVFLTEQKAVVSEMKTEDADISLGVSADGKWLAVYIERAKVKTFQAAFQAA